MLPPGDRQLGRTGPAHTGDHHQVPVVGVRGGDWPGLVILQPGHQEPHQARHLLSARAVLVVEGGQQAPVGVHPEGGVRLQDSL